MPRACYDLARLRHLGRLTRRHETVLQIDEDERRARRIETVKGLQSAAAGQRPLDRPGWNFDLVHASAPLAKVSRSSTGLARYRPFQLRDGISASWKEGQTLQDLVDVDRAISLNGLARGENGEASGARDRVFGEDRLDPL